jgi:hypothetical protein
VAGAILHLVEMPAAQRPMRTVCGLDFGAIALNEQVAPIQASTLRGLGMDHMIPPVPQAPARKAAGQ